MKRFAITIIVLGLILVRFSVVAAQGPGDHPPRPGEDPGNHPPRGDRANRPRQNNTDSTDHSPAILTTTNAVNFSLLGGENTVFDDTIEAFSQPLPGYTDDQLELFEEGDELFEQNFVAESGLGPLFNANSCESCHTNDGRGRALQFPGESESGFLIRLARNTTTDTGTTLPDQNYGGQFQDFALDSVPSEGDIEMTYTEITGTFADSTPYTLYEPHYRLTNLAYGDLSSDVTFSPRVANHMIGLGLLEAVSESTILAHSDPNDSNEDGISGRPNYVWNVQAQTPTIGRFGWKANQPNLLQQSAGAFNGDMGLTTSVFPNQSCTLNETICTAVAGSLAPEVSDEDLLAVVFYSSSLAIPAQRNVDDPLVQLGAQIFEDAGCSSCHLSEVRTGEHTIPQLANQTIHPYTDLLLHDMGTGLADGQNDFVATGSEWRTPPLWGIGLFETVNGATGFLHDGRARDLTEAILWHGGEALSAQEYFRNLNTSQRNALIAFLESL